LASPHFISAVGTPLTESESLRVAGLQGHLDQQWNNGIAGVLAAGTMGLLPLLTDDTYRALVVRTVEFSRGRGEVLVGAGDCSFARTRDRIRLLNELKIDGVVVLAPYFIRFSQAELLDYFRALADVSKAPLYLYDLPQRTHSKIEIDTVLALARHPNIAGIKCSDEPSYARRIHAELGEPFRVVIAQPLLVDVFLKFGMNEHLDGLYAIAPQWVSAIGRHAERGEWDEAAEAQAKLTRLAALVARFGVFQTMTTLLNAQGVLGNFAPRPMTPLSPERREELLADPTARELLGS
jgi:4-hydroxy-tetrahydrodipicolinate synthase